MRMLAQSSSPQKAKSDPCAGSVRAEGVSVAGILGLGITASVGKVTVNRSGASSCNSGDIMLNYRPSACVWACRGRAFDRWPVPDAQSIKYYVPEIVEAGSEKGYQPSLPSYQCCRDFLLPPQRIVELGHSGREGS